MAAQCKYTVTALNFENNDVNSQHPPSGFPARHNFITVLTAFRLAREGSPPFGFWKRANGFADVGWTELFSIYIYRAQYTYIIAIHVLLPYKRGIQGVCVKYNEWMKQLCLVPKQLGRTTGYTFWMQTTMICVRAVS